MTLRAIKYVNLKLQNKCKFLQGKTKYAYSTNDKFYFPILQVKTVN